MLEVKNLSYTYSNNFYLENISFIANTNKIMVIIGPNGSGKTTILKAIARLINFSGDIFLNKVNTKTLKTKTLAHEIAYMSQHWQILFPYTVYETVLQGRYAYSKRNFWEHTTQKDREFVLKCLEQTGLEKLKDEKINHLSGGQLQRVFLARTFAQDPKLIILDEPTNHLDFSYQLELINYLRSWVRQPQKMVIGTIHDLNLALFTADNTLLLENGRIIYNGAACELDFSLLNNIYKMDVQTHMLKTLKLWEK